jgi:hypothetical protein
MIWVGTLRGVYEQVVQICLQLWSSGRAVRLTGVAMVSQYSSVELE